MHFKFALREDLKNNKEFLPTRATTQSAGWDVACAFEDHQSLTVQHGQYIKIPLGLRCIAETGYWFEIKPRSSSFVKKHLHALYGTIDTDYRDQLFFCAKYDGQVPLTLSFGEKIGQIIPVKLLEMNVVEVSNEDFEEYKLWETNDRKGGFGSTG